MCFTHLYMYPKPLPYNFMCYEYKYVPTYMYVTINITKLHFSLGAGFNDFPV